MENKVYKCGICGKEYTTITDRSKCEAACVAKQKEETANTEKEKRTKELEDAIAAVNEMINKASDLLEEYLNDYGEFSTDLDCYWIDAEPIEDYDCEDCCGCNCYDYLFYVQ